MPPLRFGVPRWFPIVFGLTKRCFGFRLDEVAVQFLGAPCAYTIGHFWAFVNTPNCLTENVTGADS